MTTRVAVLHANAELYGADQVCAHVVAGMRQRGWEVDVFLPHDGPLVPVLRAAGAEIIELDPLVVRRADLRGRRAAVMPILWLVQCLRLWRHGRRRRYDLVHTNTAPALGGHVLARAARARHSVHVQEIFWDLQRGRGALDAVMSRADALICISEAVRAQFGGRAAARATVVHTGVDLPDREIDERVPFDGPGMTVVCVGRLNSWKGQDWLVRAAAEALETIPDLRIELVGDVYRTEHHHRQRLEALIAELGIDEHVALLGERRDALEIVARADVFVLPSARAEPFGMSLVEAMLLGRPVVATGAGGPVEIIRDGVDGLLVSPGEPGAIAAALRSLQADPERARAMGNEARRSAPRFSVANMVAGVLEVHDALLASQR